MAPRAVLVGMPGSGKSTIGRRLAKAMHLDLLDTDAKIVEVAGRSIPEIFAEDGEQGFRRIEAEVVKAALAEHDGIVSLGGGAITTAEVREALAGHTVVYLEISAAEGIRRTTSGATVRPLLADGDPAARYRSLMAQRVPLYRKAATIRINTNRRNPGAVVRTIAARLDPSNKAPAKSGRTGRRRRRAPWRLTSPAGAQPATDGGTAPPAQSAPTPTDPTTTQPRPTPATPAALAARRAEARK